MALMNKPHRVIPKYECTTSSGKTYKYDTTQRGGPGHPFVIGNDYCPACPNCRKMLRIYGANNESKKVLGEIMRAIHWEQVTKSVWLCDECKDDPFARQTVSDGSIIAGTPPSMLQKFGAYPPGYGLPPGYPPGYPPPGYPPPQVAPGYPPPHPGAFAPAPGSPPMMQQPMPAAPAPPPQMHQPPPPPQMAARPPPPPQKTSQGAPKGTAYHAANHAPARPRPAPAPAPPATPQYAPPPQPQYTLPPQPQYAQPPQPQYAQPQQLAPQAYDPQTYEPQGYEPQQIQPADPQMQPPPPAYVAAPPVQQRARPHRQRVSDWRTHNSSAPQLPPQQPYAEQQFNGDPYSEAPQLPAQNGHGQADYQRAMAVAYGAPGAPQPALSPPAIAAPLPPGPGQIEVPQDPPPQ